MKKNTKTSREHLSVVESWLYTFGNVFSTWLSPGSPESKSPSISKGVPSAQGKEPAEWKSDIDVSEDKVYAQKAPQQLKVTARSIQREPRSAIDQVSDSVERLGEMARQLGQVLDDQNEQLSEISDETDLLHHEVSSLNRRIDKQLH